MVWNTVEWSVKYMSSLKSLYNSKVGKTCDHQQIDIIFDSCIEKSVKAGERYRSWN